MTFLNNHNHFRIHRHKTQFQYQQHCNQPRTKHHLLLDIIQPSSNFIGLHQRFLSTQTQLIQQTKCKGPSMKLKKLQDIAKHRRERQYRNYCKKLDKENIKKDNQNHSGDQSIIETLKYESIKKCKNDYSINKLTKCRDQNSYLNSMSVSRKKQMNYEVKYLKIKYLFKKMENILSEFNKQKLNNIKHDIEKINSLFSQLLGFEQACIFRGFILGLKTNFGKLIFFLGLQLDQIVKKWQLGEFYLMKITRCLHYQIYYALMFKIPSLAMQSLIDCARAYMGEKSYKLAQYFCDMVLQMSANYSNQYYQQSALQQIGVGLYKVGNLEGAKHIHENINKISSWSRKQFLYYYNQQQYIATIYDYLFNNADLKTERKVRLVQTIVFQQDQKIDDQFNPSKTSFKQIPLSRLRRNISNFKMTQQKLNDLRKTSNQKAIKALKQSHILSPNQNRESANFNIHNLKSFVNKTESQSGRSNILICHESFNRRQDKNSHNNYFQVQKSIRHFFEFLYIMQNKIDEKLCFFQ